MEQANANKCHCNVVFISSHYHIVIPDTAAGLSNILDTTAMRSFYIVTKGEESITAQSNIGIFSYPFLLFCHGQHLWLCLKEVLPNTLCKNIIMVFRDIYVNGIISVCAFNIVNEC